ncbi:MAG: leucyl aminopeptidase family protein [Rhodoblastus sp.]|nr:leucyl aminopeptidase family protein [Rhodoblastus sp.]
MHPVLGDPTRGSVPIVPTSRSRLRHTLDALPAEARAYAGATGFDGAPGAHLIVPSAKGAAAAVLFGLAEPGAAPADPMAFGKLASLLPRGRYRIADGAEAPEHAELAYLLSAYKFSRYRKSKPTDAVLEAPRGARREKIETISEAVAFGRDLINTPANDMGPEALERAATALAKRYGARVKAVRGEQLLKSGFPLVHAVGKGAAEPPRLIDINWGPRKGGPKITLVGKGVCFDTGGLDIKPGASMLLMKKDMGGAASALAAASMIMRAGLPARLRVILPIVENSVSAQSFRPGDVYPSRAGLTVEIGNTDAEGRLILADALALADEDEPDLLVDFATLTGAARVALGPDLPAYFTGDEKLAGEIAAAGATAADPVWRLPLWAPYGALLDSKTADLNNVSSGPFAGAIVAAMFLKRFVRKTAAWAHFDVYNWNGSTKPGRPEGGDIQAARLVFELVSRRIAAIAG